MMPEQNNRKRIVLIAGIAFFVVAVLFIIFSTSKTKPPTSATTGPTSTYYDPTSGEQVVTQVGKAQESMVSSPSIPTYAGFDDLLSKGMTLSQLHSLYSAFEKYTPFASNKVQISLATDLQKVQPDNADPLYRWSITSHVVINRKDTYHVQLYYWGVNTVQLVLYNADGSQQIFDSGAVDTSDNPNID